MTPGLILAGCLGAGVWGCSGGQSFDEGTDGLSNTREDRDAGPDSESSATDDASQDAPETSDEDTSDEDTSDEITSSPADAFDAGSDPTNDLPIIESMPTPADGGAAQTAEQPDESDSNDDSPVEQQGPAEPEEPEQDAMQSVEDVVVTPTCADVANVDERQRDDLHVVGSGFDEYDGQLVRVLATHGEPSYGLGEARIRNGAFDLLLPRVLGDYTGLAVHIDTNENAACDPDSEFIWQMATGPAPGDTLWEVSPDTLSTFDQVGPCNLNGIFDLEITLPCVAGPVSQDNPPQADQLELVDDMDHTDDSLPVLPEGSGFVWGSSLGNWFVTWQDGSSGDAQMDDVVPAREYSQRAYHVVSPEEPVAVNLWAQLDHPMARSFDLSEYVGIAFWARSESFAEFVVSFSKGGTYFLADPLPVAASDASFTAAPKWQRYVILFDDLGIDTTSVSSFDFIVGLNGEAFDFWVDDIALICLEGCD